MKTFETEKNNIPEGATHYVNETSFFHFSWGKYANGELELCHPNGAWTLVDEKIFANAIKPIPKPEVVEWKNGDELDWLDCDNKWCKSEHMFVGEKSNGHPVIEHKTTGNVFETYWSAIRKPESPEEKEKCERLGAAYDLYHYAKKESLYSFAIVGFEEFISDFSASERDEYLAIVDKTNYRKGE